MIVKIGAILKELLWFQKDENSYKNKTQIFRKIQYFLCNAQNIKYKKYYYYFNIKWKNNDGQ